MQLDNCSQIFTLGPEGTFSDEAAQKIRGDGVIVTLERASAKVPG
jgi:prephenate dehydratase